MKKQKKIKGLRIMEADNMDITKINLDMGALGIDGAETGAAAHGEGHLR